ncbi:hypothetical protein D9758_014366 [Tetrapyrgos nigripes]|uniref:BTB domain-containing protein n=1 Tax=Tetrapyrgos nigripes TaxID=182062 RepID=A0A8H5C8S5_9AGAR|nr:hypothetical protein D9758_014366 [Tetrapyrgos nigripes]
MSSKNPKRNENYFWDTVTFLVEQSLFRVPRYHFEKNSEVFGDMFSLPQGEPIEGNDEQHPIKLEGVEAHDFEHLLRALYPRNPPSLYSSKSEPDWRSVLKLSTLWRFLEFRQQAIDKLYLQLPEEAHEKITLGHQYHVCGWIKHGYIQLVERPQVLSMEEVEKLGYPTAVHIFRLREHFTRKKYRSQSSTTVRPTLQRTRASGITAENSIYPSAWTVERAVEEEFKVEFEKVRKEGALFSPRWAPLNTGVPRASLASGSSHTKSRVRTVADDSESNYSDS